MDAALDAIRLAAADGASTAERARGAALCRAIADMLDGSVGAPRTLPAAADAAPEPKGIAALERLATALRDPSTRATVQAQLAAIDVDELLDVALASLRGMMPATAGTAPGPVGRPFRVPLVPIPGAGAVT